MKDITIIGFDINENIRRDCIVVPLFKRDPHCDNIIVNIDVIFYKVNSLSVNLFFVNFSLRHTKYSEITNNLHNMGYLPILWRSY